MQVCDLIFIGKALEMSVDITVSKSIIWAEKFTALTQCSKPLNK